MRFIFIILLVCSFLDVKFVYSSESSQSHALDLSDVDGNVTLSAPNFYRLEAWQDIAYKRELGPLTPLVFRDTIQTQRHRVQVDLINAVLKSELPEILKNLTLIKDYLFELNDFGCHLLDSTYQHNPKDEDAFDHYIHDQHMWVLRTLMDRGAGISVFEKLHHDMRHLIREFPIVLADCLTSRMDDYDSSTRFITYVNNLCIQAAALQTSGSFIGREGRCDEFMAKKMPLRMAFVRGISHLKVGPEGPLDLAEVAKLSKISDSISTKIYLEDLSLFQQLLTLILKLEANEVLNLSERDCTHSYRILSKDMSQRHTAYLKFLEALLNQSIEVFMHRAGGQEKLIAELKGGAWHKKQKALSQEDMAALSRLMVRKILSSDIPLSFHENEVLTVIALRSYGKFSAQLFSQAHREMIEILEKTHSLAYLALLSLEVALKDINGFFAKLQGAFHHKQKMVETLGKDYVNLSTTLIYARLGSRLIENWKRLLDERSRVKAECRGQVLQALDYLSIADMHTSSIQSIIHNLIFCKMYLRDYQGMKTLIERNKTTLKNSGGMALIEESVHYLALTDSIFSNDLNTYFKTVDAIFGSPFEKPDPLSVKASEISPTPTVERQVKSKRVRGPSPEVIKALRQRKEELERAQNAQQEGPVAPSSKGSRVPNKVVATDIRTESERAADETRVLNAMNASAKISKKAKKRKAKQAKQNEGQSNSAAQMLGQHEDNVKESFQVAPRRADIVDQLNKTQRETLEKFFTSILRRNGALSDRQDAPRVEHVVSLMRALSGQSTQRASHIKSQLPAQAEGGQSPLQRDFSTIVLPKHGSHIDNPVYIKQMREKFLALGFYTKEVEDLLENTGESEEKGESSSSSSSSQ